MGKQTVDLQINKNHHNIEHNPIGKLIQQSTMTMSRWDGSQVLLACTVWTK